MRIELHKTQILVSLYSNRVCVILRDGRGWEGLKFEFLEGSLDNSRNVYLKFGILFSL
jgi:hypothetical protein